MTLHRLIVAAFLAGLAPQSFAELETVQFSSTESADFLGNSVYCCSPENMTPEPYQITARHCDVQGGYCMSGQRSGAWVFELPQLPPETTFASARFTGQHPASAAGWGALGFRRIGDEPLSGDSSYTTMFSPDASTSTYWSGTTFTCNGPSRCSICPRAVGSWSSPETIRAARSPYNAVIRLRYWSHVRSPASLLRRR